MMCRLIPWHHQQNNAEYISDFHCRVLFTNTIIFIKGKIVTNFLPAKDDLPLNLDVPKPSFANAGPRSTFGFRPQDSEGHQVAEDDYAMNEDADETGDFEGGLLGVEPDEDIYGGNNSFFILSMCSHILLPDPVQPIIEDGNLGSSLPNKL